jgi:hypothetical protein
LEAAGKVLEAIGLEVHGANRVEVRAVDEDSSVIIWHEFPGDENRANKLFGIGLDGRD